MSYQVLNYGQTLDKLDSERVDQLTKEDIIESNSRELKEKLFGKVITRMHDKNTTLLSGPTTPNPNNIIPFLYFYNSVSLQLCSGCPQVLDPSMLRPFLDRKLISVFLMDTFSNTTKKFQELASEYPDLIVGHRSYYNFKSMILNKDSTAFPAHENHHCVGCSIREKIGTNWNKVKKLKRPIKHDMIRIADILVDIPIPPAESAADLYVSTLKKPTLQSVRELDTTVNTMYYLSSATALNATPQIDSRFIELPEFFVDSLRISHNPNANLEQYLDVVKGFKGTLSPELILSNHEKILSKIVTINEEIDKLESSKRLMIGMFLSKFALDIPSILTRILTQGTFGFEESYRSSLKNYHSLRLSEIKSNILSKYFGISKEGIQIWEIRKKISSIKNQK
jgi:hypothetical protein